MKFSSSFNFNFIFFPFPAEIHGAKATNALRINREESTIVWAINCVRPLPGAQEFQVLQGVNSQSRLGTSTFGGSGRVWDAFFQYLHFWNKESWKKNISSSKLKMELCSNIKLHPHVLRSQPYQTGRSSLPLWQVFCSHYPEFIVLLHFWIAFIYHWNPNRWTPLLTFSQLQHKG